MNQKFKGPLLAKRPFRLGYRVNLSERQEVLGSHIDNRPMLGFISNEDNN